MNQIEIVNRQDEVMTALLRGSNTREIVKTITQQYAVSKPTVERDISHCYDLIKKEYSRDLPQVIATHIGKYEEIHRSAMELTDFRSAIVALQSIEKLLKLHVEQPLVMLQQNNLNLESLSLDELKAMLTQ